MTDQDTTQDTTQNTIQNIASSSALTRPTDGRLPQAHYTHQTYSRARIHYAMGIGITKIDDLMGLPKGTANKWRYEKRPDGQDWDLFRNSLDIADVDQIEHTLGSPGTLQVHDRLIRDARRLLAIGMTVLDERPLYDKPEDDDTRQVVNVLYTEGGRAVPMCIRPENMSQAIKTFEVAERVISRQTEFIERYHAEQQLQMREQGTTYRLLYSQLKPVITKLLGAEAWEKVDAALTAGKTDDEEAGLDEDSRITDIDVADEDDDEMNGYYIDDEIEEGYGEDDGDD